MVNISAKTAALAGISLAIAGSIAVVNTISQGFLYEIKKANAAVDTAVAEMEKAKSTVEAAREEAAAAREAARLQGVALMVSARENASAVRVAANTAAVGLVRATQEEVHADNDMYDKFTDPLFSTPTRRIAELNEQIVRLKRDAKRGIDHQTGRPLSESDKAEKVAKRLLLEEDLATVQESSSKNLSDAMNAFMGAINQGIGGVGGLYSQPAGTSLRPRPLLVEE